MFKFAHIGDCHLGAFREQSLRKLSLDSFEKAIDECLKENVEFIVLSGDLFDTSHPSLEIVASCVKKIKQAKEAGIRVYMVYGSHDYNVGTSSIIDILSHAGLFTRLPEMEKKENGKIAINTAIDSKTGTKITGMFGMPNGREKEYYGLIDLEKLESETGFKIFMFHSAIEDFRPEDMKEMSAIPLSMFPKNFDYYAGGHVHRRFETVKPGYGKIVFPGILFGSSGQDLEQNTKEPNGFYIVSVENGKIKNSEFRQIKVCDIKLAEFDASGKTSIEAKEHLAEFIEKIDAKNKLILLKIFGELSKGSTGEVETFKARKKLLDMGAIEVYLNSNGLCAKEQSKLKIEVTDSTKIENIESAVFRELQQIFKTNEKSFSGENGIMLSEKLLRILREPKKEGETKQDYTERILAPVKKILGDVNHED